MTRWSAWGKTSCRIRCRDEATSNEITSAGLKRSGPLTNADVQQLVRWYLGNMSAVDVGAGVPESD